MKRVFPFAFFLLTSSLLAQGIWTRKADLGGNGRYAAVAFSIGTKGYIGTGRIGTYPNYTFFKDLWEWDQTTDTWTQKADFGGTARAFAVGFSIGQKGYIGTGGPDFGWGPSYEKDFWEYDPITNTWTKKADYIGTNYGWGAFAAPGFSIGTKGYIGKGYDNSGLDSLFEWEGDTSSPTYNTWSKKATVLAGLVNTADVVIGNKGYCFTGEKLWEWDQGTNGWTQKANFTGLQTGSSTGFSIGTKAYFGTGFDMNSSYRRDFWEWDQTTNTWTKKVDFSGTNRKEAVGFSIGSKGYIGTGTGWFGDNKDLWEFDPNGNGISEAELENSISVYPNPAKGNIKIQSSRFKVQQIKIFDPTGKLVQEETINIDQETLNYDLSSQPGGIYFLHLKTDQGAITKKILIAH